MTMSVIPDDLYTFCLVKDDWDRVLTALNYYSLSLKGERRKLPAESNYSQILLDEITLLDQLINDITTRIQ